MPDTSAPELTVQVTWHFYLGLLAFMSGDDKKVSFALRTAENSLADVVG